MGELTVKDRIRKVLHDHNDASIYSIAKNDNERTNMQRQINGNVTVSVQTLKRVVEAFPETSMHWLVTGEGPQDRTKIVTPPAQHHQDIHLDAGATAAISQSGEAKVESQKADDKPTYTPDDIARFVRDNDLGGLIGIIFHQQQQILRLTELRNHDLEREIHLVDNQLFK